MAYTGARMRTILRPLATAGAAAALALTLVLTPVPAAAVVVDGIAAVVNGEVITLLELEKAGRLALEERLRSAPAAEQERLRREVLSAILEPAGPGPHPIAARPPGRHPDLSSRDRCRDCSTSGRRTG